MVLQKLGKYDIKEAHVAQVWSFKKYDKAKVQKHIKGDKIDWSAA